MKGDELSRVNHDCWEYLELLTTRSIERLGLDMLPPGEQWAVMALPTFGVRQRYGASA